MDGSNKVTGFTKESTGMKSRESTASGAASPSDTPREAESNEIHSVRKVSRTKGDGGSRGTPPPPHPAPQRRPSLTRGATKAPAPTIRRDSLTRRDSTGTKVTAKALDVTGRPCEKRKSIESPAASPVAQPTSKSPRDPRSERRKSVESPAVSPVAELTAKSPREPSDTKRVVTPPKTEGKEQPSDNKGGASSNREEGTVQGAVQSDPIGYRPPKTGEGDSGESADFREREKFSSPLSKSTSGTPTNAEHAACSPRNDDRKLDVADNPSNDPTNSPQGEPSEGGKAATSRLDTPKGSPNSQLKASLEGMSREHLIAMCTRMHSTIEHLQAMYDEEMSEKAALEDEELALNETLQNLLTSANNLKVTAKSTHMYDRDWESSLQDARAVALPYVRALGGMLSGQKGGLQVNEHLGDLPREPSMSPEDLRRLRAMRKTAHKLDDASPITDRASSANQPSEPGLLDRLAMKMGDAVTAAVEGASNLRERAASGDRRGNASQLKGDPAMRIGAAIHIPHRTAPQNEQQENNPIVALSAQASSPSSSPATPSFDLSGSAQGGQEPTVGDVDVSPESVDAKPFIIAAKIDMSGSGVEGVHMLFVRATEGCGDAAERFTKGLNVPPAYCSALTKYLSAVEDAADKFPVHESVCIRDLM